MVAHTANPSTWEVKAGESDVLGPSWLHSELEVDLGHTVSTLPLNIKRTENVQGAFADARKIRRLWFLSQESWPKTASDLCPS